jgi:pyruvate dehydrogenase E2 component (dihydrolipoamide acetyltransferase)
MTDAVHGLPATVGLKGEITETELTRNERTVARRSAEIRATVPDLEFTAVVEMSHAEARAADLGIGVVALVLEATAQALRAVPHLNGAYRDGRYEHYQRVNVGVTIFDDGVYAIPTVFDADQKGPLELDAELQDYARRARSDELASAELTGATFTLTGPPGSAVTSATPLVIAPQAAALATGMVQDQAVVSNSGLIAGRTMVLTLACDGRIVHGHRAAAFLAAVKDQLESAD